MEQCADAEGGTTPVEAESWNRTRLHLFIDVFAKLP